MLVENGVQTVDKWHVDLAAIGFRLEQAQGVDTLRHLVHVRQDFIEGLPLAEGHAHPVVAGQGRGTGDEQVTDARQADKGDGVGTGDVDDRQTPEGCRS